MEYVGSSLTAREWELCQLKIDPSHRQDEPVLVGTRWFDYSNLHPVQATYLYAHLYREQTRIFYESYVDSRTAEQARAFTPADIFMSRDMTSMWLARRFADSHGLPYPFVLQFAQARCFESLWSRFPRPNQLYGESLEIDLCAAWTQALATTMRYSREDRFKASNYRSTRIQKRHAAFVIGQIKGRQRPHVNLLARMFNEDVLSPLVVEGYFTDEEVASAQQVAADLAVSHR